MKCDNCPAQFKEGYEYPGYYCGLGEEDREFYDGSVGCNRKSRNKIKKDLEIVRKIDNEAFAYECGKMVEFWESENMKE